MSEKPEDQKEPKDLKALMPTERKSVWRTAEERRMSDLTRVLEWLERRKGKKKQPKREGKERRGGKENEGRGVRLVHAAFQCCPLPVCCSSHASQGLTPTDTCSISELDIKDVVALESTPRAPSFRRQSLYADPSIPENAFGGRRMTIMKDWPVKTSDITFERKLKSLMEKGTEPKIESVKMLRPEEVLSCRYLRLSSNNIRTLFKLCKDVGLNMDIHPHMTETEIDVQKVFPKNHNAAA
uniref:Uncharacterized protein n=1 Tax=Cavia porcellus TaxID=10141 RepID=H0VV52_CAVPO